MGDISQELSGEELVLLASLLAIQLTDSMTVEEVNTFITFLSALSHNMTLIISQRDPEDIIL